MKIGSRSFCIEHLCQPVAYRGICRGRDARRFFERLNASPGGWERALRLIISTSTWTGTIPCLFTAAAGEPRDTAYPGGHILRLQRAQGCGPELRTGGQCVRYRPVEYEAFGEAVQSIAEFWLETNRV